jgi:hypothetical protein
MLDSAKGCFVVLAAAAVVGCGQDSDRAPSVSVGAKVVSVGQPVAPESVSVPGPGAIELRAAHPGRQGGPSWYGVVLSPPPGRPRDVCVAVGIAAEPLTEADVDCDGAVADEATSFANVFGIPDRYGRPPTVIAGVAPRGVRAVRLSGPGGTRSLPLSAHRGFLALYSAKARGEVRLVSEFKSGATVRTFELPLPPNWSLRPHHRNRRPGAVFSDEIGEPITQLTYRELMGRFGPPAVLRREGRLRCAYYEVVGDAGDGWRFCFARDGRMVRAGGNSSAPHLTPRLPFSRRGLPLRTTTGELAGLRVHIGAEGFDGSKVAQAEYALRPKRHLGGVTLSGDQLGGSGRTGRDLWRGA